VLYEVHRQDPGRRGWDEALLRVCPMYFLAKHFPILRERVELLALVLNGQKPKSWEDLPRDRRDNLQWWTFWLISIDPRRVRIGSERDPGGFPSRADFAGEGW
jgi:hypothetical protein